VAGLLLPAATLPIFKSLSDTPPLFKIWDLNPRPSVLKIWLQLRFLAFSSINYSTVFNTWLAKVTDLVTSSCNCCHTPVLHSVPCFVGLSLHHFSLKLTSFLPMFFPYLLFLMTYYIHINPALSRVAWQKKENCTYSVHLTSEVKQLPLKIVFPLLLTHDTPNVPLIPWDACGRPRVRFAPRSFFVIDTNWQILEIDWQQSAHQIKLSIP